MYVSDCLDVLSRCKLHERLGDACSELRRERQVSEPRDAALRRIRV
jgi:hypothetical protein